MKRLMIVLTLVSTPALSSEWTDEQSRHVGEETTRALMTPVLPAPAPAYEPRSVEIAHPYTYVTPEGDTGTMYLQRRD